MVSRRRSQRKAKARRANQVKTSNRKNKAAKHAGKTSCSAAVIAIALTGLAACSAVHTVATPPTARQAAALLGATGFTDCGASPVAGVADAGIARYQGEKIGIDTFATTSARNSWITMAAAYSVEPKWEGATWVAYKSVFPGGC